MKQSYKILTDTGCDIAPEHYRVFSGVAPLES